MIKNIIYKTSKIIFRLLIIIFIPFIIFILGLLLIFGVSAVIFYINAYITTARSFENIHQKNQIILQKILYGKNDLILQTRFQKWEKQYLCYNHYYQKESWINFDKIKETYTEIPFEKIRDKYEKQYYLYDCIDNHYINKIESTEYFIPPFHYINNQSLLISGTMKNIELASWKASNARIFINSLGNDQFRALVIYPSSNIIKMVTYCEKNNDGICSGKKNISQP
ncbi:hypothetical protein ACFFHT_07325 [Gallibacterium melopsittaci]|uniref:Uncharacterized protein n=1 Tax=Gallibacterium melopsittaci TaxID=516063 RepID=A0ABV6HWW2_9PAST